MGWIRLCGMGPINDNIIYSLIALTLTSGFFSLRYFHVPVIVPPVPIPDTSASIFPQLHSISQAQLSHNEPVSRGWNSHIPFETVRHVSGNNGLKVLLG